MKTTTAALLFVLALPGGPRWAPAEGTVRVKTFELETSAELVEFTATLGGSPVPSEYLPDLFLAIEHTGRWVVTDEYLAVDGDGPARIRRTFDEIAETAGSEVRMPPVEDTSEEGSASCALEAVSVTLTRDGDGEWSAETDDESVDADALAAVRGDMDLAGFLPAEDVEVGDSWTVDAGALDVLFAPCGDLPVEWDREGPWAEAPETAVTADAEATFLGVRSGDAGEYLAIELAVTVEHVSERATDLEHVPVADGTATETATSTYELAGELAWSPDGHLVWMRLSGPRETVFHTAKDPGQPGPDFTSTLVLEGELVFDARSE